MTNDGQNPNTSHKLQQLITAIGHRKAVVALQTNLEDAWRGAVAQFDSLNRPLPSDPLPDGEEKEKLQEAETKRRRMEAMQQAAFLVFQNITEEKNKGHLEFLAKIEYAMKQYTRISDADIAKFLENDEKIKADFQKRVETTRTNVRSIQAETQKVKLMPCQEKLLDKKILYELDLLERFLQDANTLLDNPN